MLNLLSVYAILCASVLGVDAHLGLREAGLHNNPYAPDASRVPSGMHVGVCYYPSQWPESMWESDISQMKDDGVTYVRINDFDWGILEPHDGQFNFTVLDKSIEVIAKYGLKAIIATPTAGPPVWASENYSIGFVDSTNVTKIFGSRRQLSLSSFDFRKLSQRITQKLAERYGNNPTVVGWQIDNEIGCYGTIQSYDQDAVIRFRSWLKDKYGTIEEMNRIQGRVFWTTQYESFDQVQPPFLQVAQPPPTHDLDWWLFSSDMTIDFAKEQAQILRQYAPKQYVTTNFMQGFSEFDHFKFAKEVGLDWVGYDIYPLGGPSVFPFISDQEQIDYAHVGMPDYMALNSALFRGISGAVYNTTAGPFGILEMETGFAGWIQYRVAPLVGMVRLWGHETFAESGDLVSYYRFRQSGFAAEMTHAGLMLPDNTPDAGLAEEQELGVEDLPKLRDALQGQEGQADIVLVFDYVAIQSWAIEPFSGVWDGGSVQWTKTVLQYWELTYRFYAALRRLGLSVDVVGTDQPIDNYKMVVIPSLPIISESFNAKLASYNGTVIWGPYSGARTSDFRYVPGMAPSAGTLRDRLPFVSTRVETPGPNMNSGIKYGSETYNISGWEEWLTCARGNSTSNTTITFTSPTRSGKSAACSKNGYHYIGFNPPIEFLVSFIGDLVAKTDIKDLAGRPANKKNDLGPTMRLVRRGNLLWAFNYGMEDATPPSVVNAEILIGTKGPIAPAGLTVWKLKGRR